jgi:transcriptional regulator NrdR family protein
VTTKSLSAKFNPYGKATSWRYGLATKKGRGTIGNKLKVGIELKKEKGKLLPTVASKKITSAPITATTAIRNLREIKAVFFNRAEAKKFAGEVAMEIKKIVKNGVEYKSGKQLGREAAYRFINTKDVELVKYYIEKVIHAPHKDFMKNRIKDNIIDQLEKKGVIEKNAKNTVRDILDKLDKNLGINVFVEDLSKKGVIKPEKKKEALDILATYKEDIETAGKLPTKEENVEAFVRSFIREAKAAGMGEKETNEVLEKAFKECNASIKFLNINHLGVYNEFKKQGINNLYFKEEPVDFKKIIDKANKSVEKEEKEINVNAFEKLYQRILKESSSVYLSDLIYSNPTLLLGVKKK